jgi:hypothetical protein
VRRALIAAAVTSGLVAVRRRSRLQPPPPAADPEPEPAPAVVPTQRAKIVEGDAELSVADQEAEDDRILALLDRL